MRPRFAVVMLVGCATVLPLVSMAGKSISGDELAHIPAGYSYLLTREVVLNPMHPPLVKELCALPLLFLGVRMPVDAATIRERGRDITYQWKFGEDFLEQNPPVERLVFWSRVPAVLMSTALALLVAVWAAELWGPWGGALSLFLYVFDPTITAHAQFVTTDVGFALFATLFVYSLRHYVSASSSAALAAVGVALGLAFAAKFSAVVLIPVAACLLALWGGRRALLALPIMLAIASLLVWAIYFFPNDPLFYWKGLHEVKGDFNPRAVHLLMGELGTGPWYGYFLVAWLVKTPLPELAIIAAAIVALAFGVRGSWREESFVLLPLCALFAGYSLYAPPLGVRYVIPCYPFLYVLAGRLGMPAVLAIRGARALIVALAIWYVAEFATIWPDHLPYFNQFAGGFRGGTVWLDDSNVDWGQGLIELREYLREHAPSTRPALCYFGSVDPRLYGIDARSVWIDDLVPRPKSGRWILSSFCVARARLGLALRFGDGAENWIDHRAPTAIVGHVYYVYDFDDD